jgi:outer membrane protein assembly factor BamB
MDLTRRQVLGIAGIATACTAGAASGVSLGLARRHLAAARPQDQHGPPGAYRPEPLWHLQVPSDVLLMTAGAAVYAWSSNKNHLYAVSAANGSMLWETPAPWSTPVLGKGLMYALSADGGLYALNTSSGRRQWDSAEAGGSNPLLGGAVLYTGGGASGISTILALDAQTGRTLWEVPAISGAVGGIEAPFAVTAGTVYTSTGGAIRALDASNGTEMWRWFVPGSFQTMSPSPQVTQGVVYGGYSIYDSNETVQFALGARDGSLLWSRIYPTPLIAMAVVDGIIYTAACFENGAGGPFGGTEPTLLAATTIGDGAHVWTKSMPMAALTFTVAETTAVLSVPTDPEDGGIVYPGGAGETELRALNLSSGQHIWSVTSAGWELTAAPVIAGDWVCAGFQGESIRVINLRTGATRWNLPMLAASAPAAHNGKVFAVGADAMDTNGGASPEGTLYAVPI